MPDDKLTAALDEIRERHTLIDEPCGDFAVVVGRFKHSTDDVPRLLAALDEVLKLHTPIPGDQGWCSECGHSFPCLTQRGISRALLGEEGGDG